MQYFLIKILAVLPDISPTAMIYTVRPLTRLARQGVLDFTVVIEKEVTAEDVRGADLVVLVRNAGLRTGYVLQAAASCNIPVVYDLDDNLWEIPDDSPSKRRHSEEQMDRREQYMRAASLVKVYNSILAGRVRRDFNPNVYQALAGIDLSFAPPQPPQRSQSKIRIVYATARGASDPLYSLIAVDVRKALIEMGPRVELVVWRERPSLLTGLPNVRVMPSELDYENYMRHLTNAGYDIGLAPLHDTVFYNSKTNTKFRDYGLSRIAGVYSDVPLYAEVQDGITGLVVKKEQDSWYRAMKKLVEDAALREKIQESAFAFVREHYGQERMEAEWIEILSILEVEERAKSAARDSSGRRLGAAATWMDGFPADEPLIEQAVNPKPAVHDSRLTVTARRFSFLGLVYRLRVPEDRWNTLVVTFGTYQREYEGQLEVVIRQAVFPYKILRRVILYGGEIVDNELCGIYFDPIDHMAGKDVLVQFISRSKPWLRPLALYEVDGGRKRWQRLLDVIDWKGGKLNCTLLFITSGQ